MPFCATPKEATRSSIANLATQAGVSEPSVNRFCKKFGASGFPDFKLQLARSLASGVRYVSRAVEFSDDINTFPRKLFDNAISALMTAREDLPLVAIERAVDHIAQARRVFFFGLGTSAAVARDAEHKFFRFNVPVSTHEDAMMLRMLSASGGVGDVFFYLAYWTHSRAGGGSPTCQEHRSHRGIADPRRITPRCTESLLHQRRR